jgi:hypothetical protein
MGRSTEPGVDYLSNGRFVRRWSFPFSALFYDVRDADSASAFCSILVRTQLRECPKDDELDFRVKEVTICDLWNDVLRGTRDLGRISTFIAGGDEVADSMPPDRHSNTEQRNLYSAASHGGRARVETERNGNVNGGGSKS